VSGNTVGDLLKFLARLKTAHIHYTLSDPTEGAVMIEISVPGERWEVEFHDDGRVSVETFVSLRGVQGHQLLEELFERFSD
jgi:hypothetical protein